MDEGVQKRCEELDFRDKSGPECRLASRETALQILGPVRNIFAQIAPRSLGHFERMEETREYRDGHILRTFCIAGRTADSDTLASSSREARVGIPLQHVNRLIVRTMDHATNNPNASVIRSDLDIGRLDWRLRGSWTDTWPARIKLAIVAILVWTAVGLFLAVPEMLLRGFVWLFFVGKLVGAWTWALLTPAILLVDRRLASGQQNVVRLSVLHLLLSVPFSLAHTYLVSLFEYPIEEIWWNPLRSREFAIYYFLAAWMTYCAFVGVLQTFKFNNRFLRSQFELERVEKRLLESRLNALRLQLEPHFLFNTLNAISSELAAHPELARQMIEDLGALLRRSLECQDSNEITLAKELALLDRYLAIQKLRFGDRLDIRVDVDPETLSTTVPSLLLQPLVENAIRHGIESRMSGGMVAVTARHAGRRLQIEVVDDGVGLPPRWRMEASAGLGLRVTRERLEALYSSIGDYDLTVSRRKGGGTKVAIQIPLQNIGAETGGTAA